ncbi:hypothetical protein Y1Q_0010457 [Alligator mississippiensis]|uniref:Uncharacterized protein n=1 Tax=Alligator mississippiensis TaxID=8496 RepID=A0A151P6W7_ALLMI|nr:hypothetical protein Y1Q_0010457 [Alligator mississippiensis]
MQRFGGIQNRPVGRIIKLQGEEWRERRRSQNSPFEQISSCLLQDHPFTTTLGHQGSFGHVLPWKIMVVKGAGSAVTEIEALCPQDRFREAARDLPARNLSLLPER